MQGLGLPLAQLAHPLGGAACGGAQQYLHAVFLQQVDESQQGGGFAGAGAAGDQADAGGKGHGNGLLLQRSVFHVAFFGLPIHGLFQVTGRTQRQLPQTVKLFGYKALLPVDVAEVPDIVSGHHIPADFSAMLQLLQLLCHPRFGHADEGGGNGQQLVLRQKGVAALQVEGQHI